MEKNIFEGAKFGDKFITKSGKLAIYQHNTINNTENTRYLTAILFTENTIIECVISNLDFNIIKLNQEYIDNGKAIIKGGSNNDIVSKYQEPSVKSTINEEKLDELADEYANLYYDDNPKFRDIRENIKAAYINGYYCKVIEE